MQIVPRRETDATRPFVLDDVPLPPPQAYDTTPTPPASDSQTQAALKVVTVANIAMSAIVIIAMLKEGNHVLPAILSGCAYFLSSTVLFTFIITGSLSAVAGQLLHAGVERRRIDAYQELGERMLEWRMAQEIGLSERRGPAQGVHRLSPLGDSPNYVTPYLDGEQAAVEAVRFAVSLYGADGLPDRRKMDASGRLKVRMIGSKRGGGSRESGIFLLRNGVIRRVERGYALDVLHFPDVQSVRRLL